MDYVACPYCSEAPNSHMLVMRGNQAHVRCVIRELNKLPDPEHPWRTLRIVQLRWNERVTRELTYDPWASH